MTDWTTEELDKVGSADELEIAPLRRDGTLRAYLPSNLDPMLRPEAVETTLRLVPAI